MMSPAEIFKNYLQGIEKKQQNWSSLYSNHLAISLGVVRV